MSARLRLPTWVVPPLHAVEECTRVVERMLELGPYRATRRDVGVSAGLAWLTIGELSPITWRTSTVGPTRGRELDRETGAEVQWWCSGVGYDEARAENWVALSMAAGQPPPTAEDWRLLGLDARPAKVDEDPEFGYGVWRTLSWLLGVRKDCPIYTSWHIAADLPHDRPHLRATLRGGEPPAAWFDAERAAQEQARADALRWWRHVRAQVDETAAAAARAKG